MSEAPATGDAPVGSEAEPDRLIVHLEGFDGPLDLLLDLARAQKVDLAQISILALVEQYLALIEGARQVRLELAADWLVMAAWLAWLKSQLLLPAEEGGEDGEVAAGELAERLRELEAVRAAAAWLGARTQLGRDVFARGAPESFVEIDRTRLKLDVPGLVRAYLTAARRAGAGRSYRPRLPTLWSVQDALARLQRLVRTIPAWSELERFLPDASATPLQRRAAMASTLLAGLELARGGALRLRQDVPFGPVLVSPALAASPDVAEAA